MQNATRAAQGMGLLDLEEHFVSRLRQMVGQSPAVPFALALPSGAVHRVGEAPPRFQVTVRNTKGLRALSSFDELAIAEAYMDDDIDVDGDMRDVLHLRTLLSDQDLLISLWRRIQPILIGWTKSHEQWVQNHYDANNIQLYYVDRDYNTYTPGVFEREDEALEAASERKHRLAFEGLGLKANDRILEVGFGWGSFLRYAARRGVHVTGITLSRHQLAYVKENLLDKEGLRADLLYADFFEYEPKEQFDAIVMIGVIEELADFAGVMQRISRWLKPGRRAYIDFMAATRDFIFPSFVSKYIYQGITCRVYMPKFVEAVTGSPFELMSVHNDRRNYYLTAKRWYERYEESAGEVRRRYGERTYRMFRMYLAGAAYMLDDPSHLTTAFRVFLELPEDHEALQKEGFGRAVPSNGEGRDAPPALWKAIDRIRRALPSSIAGVKVRDWATPR